MSKVTLVITPFGETFRLHSEVPINGDGKRSITRATHVEYDNDRQLWTVALPTGEEIHTNTTRASALEWERKYCENLLRKGYRP